MLNNIKLYKDNPLLLIYFVVAIMPFLAGYIPADIVSVFMGAVFCSCAVISSFFILKRKEDKMHFSVVFFMLLISFIYFYSRQGSIFWTFIFNVPLIMSAFASFKFVKIETAVVVSLFLISLMAHSVPATYTDMIEEIDPYYHYKWGNQIYADGVMPEMDWKTYPKLGGISRSQMPFANPLAMAVLGRIIDLFGYGFHQAAILFPALMAGLSAIVAFFMIKEIFKDKKMVMAAATFATMALILSLAWSTKAHATDCEDDVFGGFMLMATIFMYFVSVNNRSFRLALVGALIFGVFATAWDGHRLLTLVVGLSIAMYSVFGVLRKKRSFYLLKYYLIMFIGGNIVWRVVLHDGPRFGFGMLPMHGIELAAFALAFVAVAFNDFILTGFGGRLTTKRDKTIALIIACVIIVVVIVPNAWYYFYKVGFVDVGQSSVVFKTIAEQHAFASSISGYISRLSLVLGPASILTILGLIPMLLYAFRKMHFGTMFMFCWALPMLWGLYFKSQYMFVASIPIILASSFFVLLIDKKELDIGEFYIIPLVLTVCVGLLYTPIGYYLVGYDINMIFFNVASYERVGWENALQYLGTTPENTAIVTWWDYGHWITAVSKRHVLIDNLQHDHFQIQDVAKFFMKETDEKEAFDIIGDFQSYYYKEPLVSLYDEPVNIDYIVVDWTMIGKSGAMRFIATGNLTTQEDGEYGTYTQCTFSPKFSQTDGSIQSMGDGSFKNVRTLVFPCSQNLDGIAGVAVKLYDERLEVTAITNGGEQVPWETWAKSKDASLMGVKSLSEILGVSVKYKDSLNQVPPTYKTLVYASGEFENFMLARLYFSKNIETYKAVGMADVEWSNTSEYFEEHRDFDDSYVKIWRIKER